MIFTAMHVAFDFNPVVRHPFSGFRTHGVGLVSALAERPEIEKITLLVNPFLIRETREIPECGHAKIVLAAPPFRLRRWERWWRLVPWPPLQKWCGPFDVYHCFHHLMPPVEGKPRVMTIHDLRQYRIPELYPGSRNALFAHAVSKADRYMAYSAAARQDLIDLMRVPLERIDTSVMGLTGRFAPASPQEAADVRSRLSRQAGHAVSGYALVLGSPDKRKNLSTAIRAFAKAARTLPAGFDLVVGGVTPGDEDLPAIALAEGVRDRVLLTGPLENGRMRAVLSAADVFLFLSLYEGFGLPLIEAMASGVPIISSDRSCMPEVVGEAGVLVDPMDVDAIAGQIAFLATDPAARRRFIEAGLELSRKFTWARAAEDMVACYRKAIDESRGGRNR